jgi:hypothetical protein
VFGGRFNAIAALLLTQERENFGVQDFSSGAQGSLGNDVARAAATGHALHQAQMSR